MASIKGLHNLNHKLSQIPINRSGLYLLIIITFCLLFIGGKTAIFGDEAATFLMYWNVPISTLLTHYAENNQHTLYILFARMFMALLGDHEYTFRLTAMLTGFISIPIIFQFSRLLGSPPRAAFLTAFFLTFSLPHVQYSILGRGYGFSILFSMTIIIAIMQILQEKRLPLWSALLFLSGTGMILAIPTNIHFLTASFLFLLVGFLENKITPRWSKKNLTKIIPYIILFVTIGIYFLLISSDLKRGILTNFKYAKLYETDFSLSISNLKNIFLFQSSPWGGWFYILVLIGFFDLTNRILKFRIALIFIVPVIDAWIIGVLGPPRIFLFWLPFVLFLGGLGTEGLIERFKKLIPVNKMEWNLIIFLFGMVFLAKSPIENFIKNRMLLPSTYIKDVVQVLDHMEKNFSMNTLAVLPFQNRVLRYYIEEPVSKRMLHILKTGQLDRIILIGHENTPWQKILSIGGTSIAPQLEKHISLGPQFGSIKTYEFELEIERFLPERNDLDYASKLKLNHSSEVTLQKTSSPKFLGESSLQVNRKVDESTLILETKFKKVNVTQKNTFLLKAYARKYKQLSAHSFIFQQNAAPPGILFFNVFSGVFLSNGSSSKWNRIHPFHHYLAEQKRSVRPDTMTWEIMFFLFSIPEGKIEFSESFFVEEDTSWFDGIQTFVLCRYRNLPTSNRCGVKRIQ